MREPALCCAAFYRPQGWVYFRKEKGWPSRPGQSRLTARGWAASSLARDFQTVLDNTSLFLDSLKLIKYTKFTSP